MTGTVYGLGVGPGDPELMTLKALRILRASPVLAYPAPERGASLVRAIAAPHLPGGQKEIVVRTPMAADRFPVGEIYDQAAAAIAAEAAAGRDVAVLCEGDPFFYGSFMYLFGRLAERCAVEIVPGVTSLTACAAVARMPLAARNDVLTVLPGPLEADVLRARLEATDAAAIVKLGRHFAKVREVLRGLGLSGSAHYVERATLSEARRLALDEVDPESVPYFSMILVHKRGQAWR